MDQLEQYSRLPTPQQANGHFKSYIAKFAHVSWELDVLGPPMPRAQNAARRNVALHFRSQRHVLSTQWNFLSAGRAFVRDQRMLELWNNWYETLASMEALATVIVTVVVAAGVITLAESRQR
jgi:hypothetical protein